MPFTFTFPLSLHLQGCGGTLPLTVTLSLDYFCFRQHCTLPTRISDNTQHCTLPTRISDNTARCQFLFPTTLHVARPLFQHFARIISQLHTLWMPTFSQFPSSTPCGCQLIISQLHTMWMPTDYFPSSTPCGYRIIPSSTPCGCRLCPSSTPCGYRIIPSSTSSGADPSIYSFSQLHV